MKEHNLLSCTTCVHYEACKVWVEHCNALLVGTGVEAMDFPFTCAVPNRLCKRYQPVADVVEVMRCENCMYGTEFVDVKGVLRVCGLRDDHRFPVCHDDFCSNGVRKED